MRRVLFIYLLANFFLISRAIGTHFNPILVSSAPKNHTKTDFLLGLPPTSSFPPFRQKYGCHQGGVTPQCQNFPSLLGEPRLFPSPDKVIFFLTDVWRGGHVVSSPTVRIYLVYKIYPTFLFNRRPHDGPFFIIFTTLGWYRRIIFQVTYEVGSIRFLMMGTFVCGAHFERSSSTSLTS